MIEPGEVLGVGGEDEDHFPALFGLAEGEDANPIAGLGDLAYVAVDILGVGEDVGGAGDVAEGLQRRGDGGRGGQFGDEVGKELGIGSEFPDFGGIGLVGLGVEGASGEQEEDGPAHRFSMMQMFAGIVVIREWIWDVSERLAALRARPARHAVLCWGDWHRSYPKYVVPDAMRIAARIGETAKEILRRVPEGIEGFLFHLDLSETSLLVPDRERLVEGLQERGIQVLNAGITDIRRRTVQRRLREAGLPDVIAERDGNEEELLVVKSNYNFAGRSERRLSKEQREKLGLTAIASGIRSKWDYRVVKRREVPSWYWADETLAIERFVRNAEGRLHRFRICLDRWAVSSCVGAGTIADFQQGTDFREELVMRGAGLGVEVGQAFRAAESLGLEFGAMDAIVDDHGDCYVIDVNPTPGISATRGPRIEFMRRAWESAGADGRV